MKKLLMGSVALTLFSISIVIFQMSCKKDATAQTGGLTQLNKIIYTKLNTSIVQRFEIWTSNYDGTNQTKLNVIMPTGFQGPGDGDVKLSPNGQKIFFTSLQTTNNSTHIFACNIDGTSLTRIIDGSSAGTEGLFLGAAY